MLPGELEARTVEAKRFDPIRRKLVPTHSTLLGVCMAYYAGMDNVRCTWTLALAGNIVEQRALPPNVDTAVCN